MWRGDWQRHAEYAAVKEDMMDMGLLALSAWGHTCWEKRRVLLMMAETTGVTSTFPGTAGSSRLGDGGACWLSGHSGEGGGGLVLLGWRFHFARCDCSEPRCGVGSSRASRDDRKK